MKLKSLLLILTLVAIIGLTACSTEKIESTSKTNQKCNLECETPMEYMIQSNCPFTSICYKDECRVACPISFESLQAEENKEIEPMCTTNSECDCNWRADRTKECVCLDNLCYSIEE